MAEDDWVVQLQPVDWASKPREAVRRQFIDLPGQEEPDADEVRKALGVQVEDVGGQWALPRPVQTFEELGVLPEYVLQSLGEHGITAPIPVQAQALPLVLAGLNVIGLAQTGSGKTMAFLLPAAVHIEDQQPLRKRACSPIALVLAPTRELAVQIGDEAAKVLKYSKQGNHRWGVGAVCLYGGGRKQDQLRSLSWGSHLVVATPGRLLDMLAGGSLTLERVTYFVLDEADRMLDFGFQGDVDSISSQIRPERQVLFFSATWSSDVQKLAGGLCEQGSRPVRISAGPGGGKGHNAASDGDARRKGREGIVQEVVVVDYPGDHERQHSEKQRLLEQHLHDVLNASDENKVLVFVSQKGLADELANKLWEAGFSTASMHGGKSQDSRLWTLEQFRQGQIRLLVATDVIGRGIDIPSVSHVVVFDMGSVDDYVHRIGRTARGKNGKGHALVFFEYWHKDPSIAASLAEVLEASKQPVPEDLRRIVGEVDRGEREVFDPNAKWGGSKWKADRWSAGDRWSGGNDRWAAENGGKATASEAKSTWGSAGAAYKPPSRAPREKRPEAVVPDSWDDAEPAAQPAQDESKTARRSNAAEDDNWRSGARSGGGRQEGRASGANGGSNSEGRGGRWRDSRGRSIQAVD